MNVMDIEEVLSSILREEINKEIVKGLRDGTLQRKEPVDYNGVDVFGISKYVTVLGHSWGVRGFGPTYDQFYEWFREKNFQLESDHADFPWHYFTFAKPQDEQEMIDRWAEHIMIDDD